MKDKFDAVFIETERFNRNIMEKIFPDIRYYPMPYPVFQVSVLQKNPDFHADVEKYKHFMESQGQSIYRYFVGDYPGNDIFIHPITRDVVKNFQVSRYSLVLLSSFGFQLPLTYEEGGYIDKIMSVSEIIRFGVVPGLAKKIVNLRRSEIYRIYNEESVKSPLKRGSLPGGVYWLLRKKKKVIIVNAFLSVLSSYLKFTKNFGEAFVFSVSMMRYLGVGDDEVTVNQFAEIVRRAISGEMNKVYCSCKRIVAVTERSDLNWHGICAFCGL